MRARRGFTEEQKKELEEIERDQLSRGIQKISNSKTQGKA
jgi:hypothetical protein